MGGKSRSGEKAFQNDSVGELRDSDADGGGRGLFARVHLPAGSLVHKSHLLAACALEGHGSRLCAACFRAAAESLECSCAQCEQVFFCDERCAALIGPHKAVCAALCLWPKLRRFDNEQVSLLRLLLIVYGKRLGLPGGRETAKGCSKAKREEQSGSSIVSLQELHWHPEAWRGDERASWSKPLACFQELLTQAGASWVPSVEELQADLGRLDCNAFSMPDEKGMLIGHGIYPSAAVGLNHDCSPNCCVDGEGPGTVMRVFSLRDIEEGEELCISYVDVNEPGPIRRRDLQQQYHFECRCKRCLQEQLVGERRRDGPSGPERSGRRIARSARPRENGESVDSTNPAKRHCAGDGVEGGAGGKASDAIVLAPVQVFESSCRELVDRVCSRIDVSAGVVPRFPEKMGCCSMSVLSEWATGICSLGALVSDQLYFWEGYNAKPGEDVRTQFGRQIVDDFLEMAEAVSVESGRDEVKARIADVAGIQALQSFVLSLMDLYEPPLADSASSSVAGQVAASTAGRSSESRGFCLRLEINEGGAASAKFHDDWFTVRLEAALVGAGMVLAQSGSVDWDFWDQCRGLLILPDDLPIAEEEQHFREWNAKVCPPSGEVATEAMTLMVMKGGNLTHRPCIHRAPYDAYQHPRFVVCLEKMTGAEMEKQRDLMDFGGSDDSDEEEEKEDENAA